MQRIRPSYLDRTSATLGAKKMAVHRSHRQHAMTVKTAILLHFLSIEGC
jgi:hypothetical protein